MKTTDLRKLAQNTQESFDNDYTSESRFYLLIAGEWVDDEALKASIAMTASEYDINGAIKALLTQYPDFKHAVETALKEIEP